jgi:hypothetical protein
MLKGWLITLAVVVVGTHYASKKALEYLKTHKQL